MPNFELGWRPEARAHRTLPGEAADTVRRDPAIRGDSRARDA